MTVNEKDGKVTIALEGRIDTNNAAQTEKEMFEAVEGKTGDITIDAEKLEYISSAGLRVLMKLRKSVNKPLPVTNVSRDVYDIFETTGFTELLDIRKALRELNIDGCPQIASGGQGKIYRVDDETIVKVFCNGGTIPLDYVKEEQNNAKAAFVAGVPTAISFDTVKCGEYYGIVYEMIDSKTLSQAVVDEPEKWGCLLRNTPHSSRISSPYTFPATSSGSRGISTTARLKHSDRGSQRTSLRQCTRLPIV